MTPSKAIIPAGKIEQRILLIRGQKVIIDADLAEFYGASTKALNQAVKRNRDRFPDDFTFQLTAAEKSELVTICDHLGRLKYSASLPYAFTEHGALMAASVLNSPRAVEISVFIVRAFVRLRQTLAQNEELAGKLEELERRLADHDKKILALVSAIRQLASPKAVPKKRHIGFQPEGGK